MPIDPAIPEAQDAQGRAADRIASLERQVRGLLAYMQGGAVQQVPVIDTLPAPGRQGRLVMLRSSSALYKDTGTAWVNAF